MAAAKQLSEVMRGEKAKSSDIPDSGQPSTSQDKQEAMPAQSPGKFIWTGHLLKTVHFVFKEELKSQTTNLDVVRRKIKTSDLLANIDARKVYDKLRGELQYSSKDSQEGGQDESAVQLPRECETLNDVSAGY